MEEKMNGLNEMVLKVSDYCDENKIEYIFAAVAEGGKHTIISHNTLASTVLKEATKVIQALVKTK